jgi:hypothetical protein
VKRLALSLALLTMACATAAPLPPADPDAAGINATVQAVYDVISGPAGPRDWDRFKSLFANGARLAAVRADGTLNVMTPDDYIERSKPLLEKNGFFERPVANRVEHYRDIAHVFSTYESRHASSDEKPFARGINSFQLARIGGEWKVLTIFWQAEDAQHPIPPAYQQPRG